MNTPEIQEIIDLIEESHWPLMKALALIGETPFDSYLTPKLHAWRNDIGKFIESNKDRIGEMEDDAFDPELVPQLDTSQYLRQQIWNNHKAFHGGINEKV